jgi:hypothetical protein
MLGFVPQHQPTLITRFFLAPKLQLGSEVNIDEVITNLVAVAIQNI